MRVNVVEARETLDELIRAAEAGEEVVILRDGVPAVALTPVATPGPRGPFKIGILKHVLTDPGPNFFEPMSEEDLRAWEDKD